MVPKILLTATVPWPSIARLAGGFAEAGCMVDALSPRWAPLTASRYVTKNYPYRPLSPLASLHAAVDSSQPGLIVPCDDRAVSQLLQLYDAANRAEPRLAALIRRSLGNPENYSRLASRSGFIATARKLGISAPETFPLASERDLDDRLSSFGLPAVLKADGSWGGDGIAIVRNHEEAVTNFRRLSSLSSRWRNLARAVRRRDMNYLFVALTPQTQAVSIQRFVPGTQATTCFAAWEGKVVAAFHMDVLVAQDTTGPANVIKRVDNPEMDEAARRIAQRFSLSGLHGLDYIRDAGGKAHLLEINPRSAQASYLPFGPTRDLPAALAASLARTEIAARPALEADTVAFFPREWQRDPASPYLVSAFHDVPWDDPAVLRACLGFPVDKGTSHPLPPGLSPKMERTKPSAQAGFAPARHIS